MKAFRSTCCKYPVHTPKRGDTMYYICDGCGQPCEAEWIDVEVWEVNIVKSSCCNAGVHVKCHKYGGKRWHCDKCKKSCEVVVEPCDKVAGNAEKG